ncbi:MAG: hypothetical protein ABIX28_23110 [Vicinamibacterales bacterium]
MPKYCGEITRLEGVRGGGNVTSGHEGPDGTITVSVGSAVTIAASIHRLEIGGTVLKKVRLVVRDLLPYVRQGDTACLFVYTHLHTKVIIGVKSTTGPSWELPFARMMVMLAAYVFFWPILIGIPVVLGAVVLGGFFGPEGGRLLGKIAFWYVLGLCAYSGFRLARAYRDMKRG